MTITLRELLPEELSDEAAYHLSNFIMALATAFDDIYFAQTLRYIRSSRPGLSAPPYRNREEDSDPPF